MSSPVVTRFTPSVQECPEGFLNLHSYGAGQWVLLAFILLAYGCLFCCCGVCCYRSQYGNKTILTEDNIGDIEEQRAQARGRLATVVQKFKKRGSLFVKDRQETGNELTLYHQNNKVDHHERKPSNKTDPVNAGERPETINEDEELEVNENDNVNPLTVHNRPFAPNHLAVNDRRGSTESNATMVSLNEQQIVPIIGQSFQFPAGQHPKMSKHSSVKEIVITVDKNSGQKTVDNSKNLGSGLSVISEESKHSRAGSAPLSNSMPQPQAQTLPTSQVAPQPQNNMAGYNAMNQAAYNNPMQQHQQQASLPSNYNAMNAAYTAANLQYANQWQNYYNQQQYAAQYGSNYSLQQQQQQPNNGSQLQMQNQNGSNLQLQGQNGSNLQLQGQNGSNLQLQGQNQIGSNSQLQMQNQNGSNLQMQQGSNQNDDEDEEEEEEDDDEEEQAKGNGQSFPNISFGLK